MGGGAPVLRDAKLEHHVGEELLATASMTSESHQPGLALDPVPDFGPFAQAIGPARIR